MRFTNSKTEDLDKLFGLYAAAIEIQKKVSAQSWMPFEREFIEQEIAENAAQVIPDKVGRIGLLEEHTRSVNITDEAELVGRLDKFEIWQPAAREAVRQQNKKLAAQVLKEIDL